MKVNLNVILQDLIKKEPLMEAEARDLNVHIGSKISTVLCDDCKKKVKDVPKVDEDTELSLKDACIRSLTAVFNTAIFPDEGPAKLSDKERYKRYKLFQKVDDINSGGIVDLEANDIILLKELIAKRYGQSVLILGQCWDLLEGKGQKVEYPIKKDKLPEKK